jgi:MFS family permease
MLVGTVGGGVLGQLDLAIPFVVRAGLLGVLFVLAFVGMHDVGFQPQRVTLATLPAQANALARTGIRLGWRSRPLRLIMLAGAVQNGFFFWAWYAWQPYFLELLDQDAVWVAGVVAALLALAMTLGNGLVGFFTRYCGRRTTILLWAAVAYSAAAIGVGLAGTFALALGALLAMAVAMGVTMPVRQAFIHGMVASGQRATVVSFDSMISGVGSVGGQAGLGVYSERAGYSAAYVIGGAIAAVAVPVEWLARRLRAPADPFVGAHSVEPEGCTPTGVPAIAQVEARAAEPTAS